MILLYLILKLLFPLVLMTCLTKFKYSNKKSYIILAAVHIGIFVANYVMFIIKGATFLAVIFPLTVSLPAFICFYILSETKGFKILFSFLTVFCFGMLKSYIGFLSLKIYNTLFISIFAEFLCFIIILVLILKVFRKPYFKILNTMAKGWGLLCSVPLLLTVIIYLLLYSPNEVIAQTEYKLITFLVFALMFMYYAIIYFNFDNITVFYQLKLDKEFMLSQTDMQKKRYDAIVDKINTIRIYRHDMRHHIDVMNTFLDDKNIPEVQKHLRKLNDSLSKTIVENYCENYCINVILSSFIDKAKKENIEVISKVNISENLNIDNMELGLVFANAIENAINACKKIEAINSRRITILCNERNKQIKIQITNTYVGEIQFNGEYPVSDKVDHGSGTRSIAGIAEKYGGVFDFTAKDGIFKAIVMLNFR